MQSAQESSTKELDRLTATVDTLGRELERLNAEILYWKSETDRRKLQLGEHILDDPCNPGDDSLWLRLAAREVAEAKEKTAQDPALAMTLITELVRDKQEALVCFECLLFLHVSVGIGSSGEDTPEAKLHLSFQMRLRARDGTIARLVGLRTALEQGYAELENRLWVSERRASELSRGGGGS